MDLDLHIDLWGNIDAMDQPAALLEPSISLPIPELPAIEVVSGPIGLERDLELGPRKIEGVRADAVLLNAVQRAGLPIERRDDVGAPKDSHDQVLAAVPIGPTSRQKARGKRTVSHGTETVHASTFGPAVDT
jgi:hypothetical protein